MPDQTGGLARDKYRRILELLRGIVPEGATDPSMIGPQLPPSMRPIIPPEGDFVGPPMPPTLDLPPFPETPPLRGQVDPATAQRAIERANQANLRQGVQLPPNTSSVPPTPPGAAGDTADSSPTGKPWASVLEKEFFTRLQAREPSPDVSAARERVRNLRSEKNIAEGLGRAGALVTAGDVMFGREREPFVAEDLRKDISEAELQAQPENDPNSEISRSARDILQSNGIEVPETASYASIVATMPSVARVLLGQLSAVGTSGREMRDAFGKIKTHYEGLPEIKGARRNIMDADKVITTLQKRTATADRSVATIMPRLMGEVGNLARYEQERFDKRRGIWNIVRDKPWMFATGTFLEEHRDELIDLVGILRDASLKHMHEQARRTASEWAPIYGMSEEDILPILTGGAPSAPGGAGAATADEPKVNVINPQGKAKVIPRSIWEANEQQYLDGGYKRAD